MGFYVEDKGIEFENCPPGVHLARCYSIIDLGTQKSEYMGQVKFQPKIRIAWEIHGTDDDGQPVRMKDGRPFAVFRQYTRSWSNKSNLRLDLQSWRGKPFSEIEMKRFELDKVLGLWCMLNVIEREGQDGKIYANINGVTPVPNVIKQSGLPEGINPTEQFDMREPDMSVFEGLSKSLKNKIMDSPEWAKISNKPSVQTGFSDEPQDDPIPF